jgi:hypothetical protein
MLSIGNALFSAGGKWVYNITLWNSLTYEPVEVHTVKSFGPTYSFAVMPWDGPSSVIAAGVPATSAGGPFYAGGAASSMALGYAPARATVPASVAAASCYGSGASAAAAGATAAAARAPAEAAEFNKWRLLTGHHTGQVSPQAIVLLLYCRDVVLLLWWCSAWGAGTAIILVT